MVLTWWHKLFPQGQSGVQRGDRRARVRQRLMQKPLLTPAVMASENVTLKGVDTTHEALSSGRNVSDARPGRRQR